MCGHKVKDNLFLYFLLKKIDLKLFIKLNKNVLKEF